MFNIIRKIIKEKEDSMIDMREFKTMMIAIAKKYHLVINEDCNRLRCYYAGNSNEWKGENRLPSDFLLSTYVFRYDFNNNTGYFIHVDSEVSKNSIKEWQKYIEDIFNEYRLNRFIDRDDQCMMPLEGSFECWKQCMTVDGSERVLVKLKVPEEARRYQEICNNKFRVSKAEVIGIYNTYGNKLNEITEAKPVLYYEDGFRYRLGAMVYPDRWDDREVLCSNGLHAFMRFEDAKNF